MCTRVDFAIQRDLRQPVLGIPEVATASGCGARRTTLIHSVLYFSDITSLSRIFFFTLAQVKSFSVQDFLRVPGRVLRLPQQAGGAVHEKTQCHDSFPDQIVSHHVNAINDIFFPTQWMIKLKQTLKQHICFYQYQLQVFFFKISF